MGFYEHQESLAGKTVVDLTDEGGFPDLRTAIPRLRVEYDAETTALEQFNNMLGEEHVDQLTGLVVGAWSS